MRARAREAGDPAFGKYRIVRTDKLIGYENNPRTHSEAQIAKLVASITEFGFTNPILTDGKRGVVAGHGRLLAAQKLGMETVPTLELAHLNEMQRRAYVIADNRLAEDAGWDKALLKLELGELYDGGFKLQLTGFELGELKLLLGKEGEGNTDPDEVPPLADPVSVLGDVWLLGRHRLVCGDSRDVLPTLTGIDAVVTDPPYGVNLNTRSSTSGRNKNYRGARLVERAPDHREIIGDDTTMDPALLLVAPSVIIWGGNYFADKLSASSKWLIWDKRCGGTSDDNADCELAWTNLQGPARLISHLWRGMFRAGAENMTHGPKLHPAQKPIAVMQWCIEQLPKPAATILDPFSGSGTTIIAAEMTGRSCIGIELSPAYVDVAIRRWQAFVGAEATHADGRTFAAIEAERAVPSKAARTSTRAKVAA